MTDIRLLLVEDDREAAALLCDSLRRDGVLVTHAENGVAGLQAVEENTFDVLVVDRMMPEMDGVSMVKALRAKSDRTPVLFLSALGEVDDRVDGFDAGADDYLVKPYAYAELLARVTALARRSGDAPETELQLADLTVDALARKARRGDVELDVNPREFALLEFLLRRQGQVVTRAMLLEHVWNYNVDVQTNVVDVHVSRLRSKLDKDFEIPLLHTVRGQGFVLKADK